MRSNDAFSHLPPAAQATAWRQVAERTAAERATLNEVGEAGRLEMERRGLRRIQDFVTTFWGVVEPATPYRHNWHLDVLADIITESRDARSQREVINIPPGASKSLWMSVFARAWLWSLDPSLRFLTASYGAHLSVRDNTALRTIVESPDYRRLFPHVRLTDDQNQKVKFSTTARGWSIATSTGGPGTGEHPDYVIIDDPLTAQQALSQAERDNAIAWLDQTISTRGVSRGMRIWLIMQRLHEEDPTAHVLRKGGYRHTCFPMRFDAANADPRDPRSVPEALLWPAHFDADAVRRMEIELGPYGVAGQLQQRPAPEGGGLFRRAWLPIVDAAPTSVRRTCRAWDVASTAGGGDYTVGVRLSESHDGTFHVEDVVRGQWSPADVHETIINTAHVDGRACAVFEEREGGSSGLSVITSRARDTRMRGYSYTGVRTTGSKIIRATALRSQCEAGQVRLVRSAWNEAFITELTHFPTASHDDQVDACALAFNSLIEQPLACGVPTPVGSGRSYWNGPE